MQIETRPAGPQDDEFCLAVLRAALGSGIEPVLGRFEATQRTRFAQRFERDTLRVITAEGADVGMVSMQERNGAVFVSCLAVHPDHQGTGVATALVGGLLAESARTRRALFLDVPAASERAQGLYRRLGFVAAGSMHSDIAVLRMYPQWYADAADEEEED